VAGFGRDGRDDVGADGRLAVGTDLRLIASVAVVGLMVTCAPVVRPRVAPPAPSPTPVVCTDNPAGLPIGVRRTTGRTVQVTGEGFVPGERVRVILTAQEETSDGTRGYRLEAGPVTPVSPDGTFAFDEALPEVRRGTLWHLQVVHSRGTACTVFLAGG
jgi:hypothetical protein